MTGCLDDHKAKIGKSVAGGLESARSAGLMNWGDAEMCIGGCFMVPGGEMKLSKGAADLRARATGRGRGGDC